MGKHFFRTLACLFVTGYLSGACSSSGSKTTDAASEGASASTCQQIRACLWGCGPAQQPCIQDCIARGTAQAQAAYQAIAACQAPFCPTNEFACHCQEQCFTEGRCAAETEACAAGAMDGVCDELCH